MSMVLIIKLIVQQVQRDFSLSCSREISCISKFGRFTCQLPVLESSVNGPTTTFVLPFLLINNSRQPPPLLHNNTC